LVGDFGLWLLCAAFYVFDCLTRLRPETLVLQQGWRGVWHPVLPLLSGQPRSRRFGVLPLLAPTRPALTLPWLRAVGGSIATRRSLGAFVSSVAPLGFVAQFAFLSLFVVAPVLTATRGLYFAVLVALGCHAAAMIALGVILALRRKLWRMSAMSCAALWFECLVCPGYLANVCRRVTVHRTWLDFDADRLLTRYRRWQTPSDSRRLEAYAEELHDDGDLDDRQFASIKVRIAPEVLSI
jgi:hypothetical protein